jgi:RimJ/RimL family protein N-acetyltransferase
MTALTPDYSHYFWQGEKTRLRPWRLEDAELRFITSLDSLTLALHEDGIELPTSVELQTERLQRWTGVTDPERLRFAMENLEGLTVGWVTLHSRDPKNGTFGFGVAVYRDYRGRGYATDAVGLLLKYGFWEQRYQKCNSQCIHSNQGSVALHKKLGFIEEGRIRRNMFHDGKYHDEVMFGLTREEFDQRLQG